MEIGGDVALQELTFPFSVHEPCLTEDELLRLDTIADALELKRLHEMQVLTDASDMPADSKILSTRFVRTWREKIGKTGEPIWLRRSRFVAREFAWMESERDSLFSPASSNIVARVLPAMFLDMKQHSNSIMLSIDVKDAFLTVKQQRPTIVNCQLADWANLELWPRKSPSRTKGWKPFVASGFDKSSQTTAWDVHSRSIPLCSQSC